jgi:predicted anti-sigma-YlaC factor YlaD
VSGDQCAMKRICRRARAALSADLDGEATAAEASRAHEHLRDCADCARWRERVETVNRRMRVTAAAVPPDLSRAVVEASGRVRRRLVEPGWVARAALVSLGLVQLWLAGVALWFDTSHVTREMGSVDVALALGALAVAAWPWRAGGLLPVLAALTVMLVVTSALDLLRGGTGWVRELPHLIVLGELAMVWRVRSITGPVGALPPAPSPAALPSRHRDAA